MIPKIKHYTKIVDKKIIQKLYESSSKLEGKLVTHINSTSSGGGVAEILNTLVFLMNDLGMKVSWNLIKGSHTFFKITKFFHNSLQGQRMKITNSRKNIYLEYCERNAIMNHIENNDIIIIHDPQPIGMVKHYTKKQLWFWRCHLDISTPYKETLEFFLPFIQKFDAMIVSSKKYKLKEITIPQKVIMPSIDPLSPKNKEIKESRAEKLLNKKGIYLDKPIIAQISRFDKWKDPIGVLNSFRILKQKKIDCQLVLMGDMASDDPEGPRIYEKVHKKTMDTKDVTLITEKNDILVNALQRLSHVIVQKSLREGFGITVSEALWKKTPVVATNIGGIPLQVIDGKTGFLVKDRFEVAKRCEKLIKDDKLRKEMGNYGKEHVRKNFLITRHLQDYLNLFNEHIKK
jgi:trehalose synthase